MTFQEEVVNDVSEYIDEHFAFKYQVVDGDFTALTMIDRSTDIPVLILYYGVLGYTVSTMHDLTVFQTMSYRKFVKYINSLKWEDNVYAK